MDVGWDRGGPLLQPRREPGLSLRAAGGRGAVSRTAASDVIRLGQENAPCPWTRGAQAVGRPHRRRAEGKTNYHKLEEYLLKVLWGVPELRDLRH